MAEDIFDAIVVGGGLSGLTAAYAMAQAGLEVMLIERGNYCGSKNVSGGRLYAHTLEKLIPDFADTAPVERRITKERFSARSGDGIVTAEYPAAAVAVPSGSSYSVLRATFDRWLADKCEELGVMMVCGILVDDLIVRDGRVCGVVAGEDELEANVVILADGVNSLLAQKAGLKRELRPENTLVGVKEIIALAPGVIEERFGVAAGEGLAWTFDRCAAGGDTCGGFLYTNKSSVSVGITMKIENIESTDGSVPQMLEDFVKSPLLAPLLDGGTLQEYSAHLLPAGDPGCVPELAGEGVIVVGDAASLCADLGYTIRGMDLAAESGMLAAKTVIEAKESGDFSRKTLSAYGDAIKNSFAFSCVKNAEKCRTAAEAADLNDAAAAFSGIAASAEE
jgi:electron transfer flavoprotein-quinone oxidoreductase